MSHLNNGSHSKLEGRFELHIQRALIMSLNSDSYTASLSKILLQSSAPGQQLIWVAHTHIHKNNINRRRLTQADAHRHARAHAHAHTCTHTHAYTITHTHSLSLSHAQTHTHSTCKDIQWQQLQSGQDT